MTDDDPVRLVAITGGSGSGKTWLADRLQVLLGAQAGRVTQDSFYRDWSHLPPAERGEVNFDHPDALDWTRFAEVLATLRSGRGCRLPVYDFATHCRVGEGSYVPARPVMLVDGLWLLHRPEIRRMFDLSIFLHCAEEERLRRRVARDRVERSRTEDAVRQQFHATVAPMHRQFVNPQAAHADLLIHHPCREMEIFQLEERLSRLIPLGSALQDRFLALFRPAHGPLTPQPAALSS
jgi:uridine kinase